MLLLWHLKMEIKSLCLKQDLKATQVFHRNLRLYKWITT